MRVFAISDLHLDYEENARWFRSLSSSQYRDDLLILAGDVSDSLQLLEWCFKFLAKRFRKVLYVPGNHELWVIRDPVSRNSHDKFEAVCQLAERNEVAMQPYHSESLSIVPLFGWYDYSFADPQGDLGTTWMDHRACVWPEHSTLRAITAYFIQKNEPALEVRNDTVISFSHFLPRLDLMPKSIPPDKRTLYPVLGTTELGKQIERLRPALHVYGHSHLNRHVTIDGVSYVNNAFGYPHETKIASKRLVCIYER